MSLSSLNTHQLVMLSGIDGRKISSIENLLGLKSSGGMSLEATFSRRSVLAFCILGIGAMLNAVK